MKKKLSVILTILLAALFFCSCSYEGIDYIAAVSAFNEGDYDAALDSFSKMKDYKNSLQYTKMTAYNAAKTAISDKDYILAIQYLEQCENYLDASELLIHCQYNYALALYEMKDFEQAIKLFTITAEVEYKDSELYLLRSKVLLSDLYVTRYRAEAITTITPSDMYGAWVLTDFNKEANTQKYIVFLPNGICYALSSLQLDRSTEDCTKNNSWEIFGGILTITINNDTMYRIAVTDMSTNNLISGQNCISNMKVTFKRNTLMTLNPEIDCGICLGATTETVLTQETNPLKTRSETFIQYSVNIPSIAQSYTGTRTYYFNSEGKLFKIATTLDSSKIKDIVGNYTDLSTLVNRCYYNVSCADVNSFAVVKNTSSYYENISVGDIAISIFSTETGGMLWISNESLAD